MEYLEDISKYSAIGKLQAGILHDIKSPITSIRCLIENLGSYEYIKDSEDYELINLALDEVCEIINCTGNVLSSYSKQENFSLNQSILDVVGLTSGLLRGKDVSVNNKVNKKVRLTGNKVLFNRIILNILVNSYDALNADQNKILVTSYPVSNKLVVAIFDNGCGIDSKNPNKRGWGIGTDIIREQLAKEFNGKLFYVSNPCSEYTTATYLIIS